MAELKVDYRTDQFALLFKGEREITSFLNETLFGKDSQMADKIRIEEALLNYHRAEAEFPEIVDLKITDTEFDLNTGIGKVVFAYVLGYSNTCAGTRTDLEKRDRIDFKLNQQEGNLIFSFLDVESRSTGDEF